MKDASDAKGTGKNEVYNYSYDRVWTATIEVVIQSKLDLVSKDKEDGVILAKKSLSAFSYGENVAIFVEEINENSTKVEVVSKRALQTNITAKDWSNHILSEVNALLK